MNHPGVAFNEDALWSVLNIIKCSMSIAHLLIYTSEQIVALQLAPATPAAGEENIWKYI